MICRGEPLWSPKLGEDKPPPLRAKMTYYAITIFLSAFLLFQIQPMLGKYILPWFGGTPAVWSTTMLFFQALLTGGYAYAYGLIDRLGERKQGIIHLALLGVSLILLVFTALTWRAPILPDAAWRPRHGFRAPAASISQRR